MSPTTPDTHDTVTLVDEGDMPTGSADKYRAHRHPAQLHRAVSVWLFRERKDGTVETLFQQRSEEKIVGAGWWGNAICGNVRHGESASDCALRRLDEEIGLELALAPLQLDTTTAPPANTISEQYIFHYKAWCNEEYGEHEIDHVYVGRWNGERDALELNPAEVQQVRWVSFASLRKAVQEQLAAEDRLEYFQFPDMTVSLSEKELRATTAVIDIELDDMSYAIAPWTAMMLLSVSPFENA